MRFFRSITLFSLFSIKIFSDYIDFTPIEDSPWFTGPLITPSAYTIPQGHYNIQPYLTVVNNFGLFNKHWKELPFTEPLSNINLLFFAQMGITSFMDFQIAPSFFYNYRGDQSCFRFGDLYTQLSFQLCRQSTDQGFTAKVAIGELFPTGVYQHLDPEKLMTDFSGGGAFATTFMLVFQKRWNTYSYHYLSSRFNVNCILFPQVPVHGLNYYGGDKTTKGRVFPGTAFPVLIAFEYNLTKHAAFALDIVNQIALKTRFKGKTTLPVGWGWVYSFSLAPAIEYNYSDNVGLIGGVWFSPIGRNSVKFINYSVSLNWYI